MILNAKCHAIRDAQILEKKIINGEMQHEEKRLDQMMEIDRVNSLKMQEEIERKRREERYVTKQYYSYVITVRDECRNQVSLYWSRKF